MSSNERLAKIWHFLALDSNLTSSARVHRNAIWDTIRPLREGWGEGHKWGLTIICKKGDGSQTVNPEPANLSRYDFS